MRFKLWHALLVALLLPLLTWGIYNFIREVHVSTVSLHVTVKAFNSANLQLFYNDSKPDYQQEKSDRQLLIASQFFKTLSFKIAAPDDSRYLRLDLGDGENEIFIQSVSLLAQDVNGKDTLQRWTGQEVNLLIASLHHARVDAANNDYIHYYTGGDDPYLILNSSMHDKVKAHYANKSKGNDNKLAAASVLSLFIISIIMYFLLPVHIPGLRQLLQQGFVLKVGVLGIIFAIFLNNYLRVLPDGTNAEKRALKAKPELALNNFFEYPEMYGAYAKDNFSFRNGFYFFRSVFMSELFSNSPMPDDVILGKNGWFFYNDPFSIYDYRNLSAVPTSEIDLVYGIFRKRAEWLKQRGIRFYVMVPPNKERVYGDYMPNTHFQTEKMGTNRLSDYGYYFGQRGGFDFIDPTKALAAARSKRDTYYKTDTHWNLYGGFIGYTEMMKVLKRDFPFMEPAKEEDFNISTFQTREGDLALITGLALLHPRTEYMLTFKDSAKTLSMPSQSEIVIRYENNKTIDGSPLKVLMFRDSYANYLIPFLNLHFKNAVYIWSYEFTDALIEKEKPDVVIFESLQRYITTSLRIPNPAGIDSTSI